MYPQTIGAMSLSSFMKPASKSGASYGSGDTIWVSPRENGYSRKWNIVKKFPGGLTIDQSVLVRSRSENLHQHVVTEPARNYRVVHNWLVRFVLEVTFPTRSEMGRWPAVHLFQLLFSWTNFDTGINTIRRKWASTLEIPFVEYCLLNFGDTSDKIIKTFSSGLSTVDY